MRAKTADDTHMSCVTLSSYPVGGFKTFDSSRQLLTDAVSISGGGERKPGKRVQFVALKPETRATTRSGNAPEPLLRTEESLNRGSSPKKTKGQRSSQNYGSRAMKETSQGPSSRLTGTWHLEGTDRSL